jgi:serine/threonine-protein kinase
MLPDGQAPGPEDSAIPAPGVVIASKYEVERVLGAGGMGVVVAARHIQLGRRVAIKFMRGQAAHDERAVSRCLREARSAVALSSEHVAKVLDVGTLETGEPYMVMEYLAGVDLGQVLRNQGSLGVADAMSMVMQVCEAIAEAHVLGIIHRDLKPSNLFVTTRRDGTQFVKVLDFGISKTVDFNTPPASRENLTASGLVMGSPGYMSPEQLRSAKGVDARSDIWSLGVILYELLTGEAPFTGETLGDTFARIISENPIPIRQRRRDVPEGLAAVVMRCMERDIDRRIQTVGELAVKLAPFAPPDAAAAAERIARVSAIGAATVAAHQSASGPETMTAPAFTPSAGGEPRHGQQALDTGPAWLKSGPQAPTFQRSSRGPLRIAAALVIGVAVLAALFGIYQAGPERVSHKTTNATVSAPAPLAPMTSRSEAILIEPVTTAPSDVPIGAPVDAGAALPSHSLPLQSPARGEVRRPPAARPAPRPGGPRDPGLDDLLEQRQ